MSGFLDGNFAGMYLSKNVVTFPWSDKPGNQDTACFDLTYFQWANSFTTAAVGSADANAPLANLYYQGPIERVGAGLLKFTRSFCQLPVTFYDMEQIQFTYPGLDSGVGTTNWVAFGARSCRTMSKVATIKHEFTINANIPFTSVTNITLILLNGQPTNRIGQWFYGNAVLTVPSTDPARYVVSSDPTRVKGSLWEIVTKSVSQANVVP